MENERTLKDWMLELDFGDLLDNADMMGYNEEGVMDNMDEAEMAVYLAKAVLDDPRRVLSRLPLEDLQLLKMLTDAEPGMGMKARNTTQYPAMCSLGLARMQTYDEEKGINIIGITDDFRQAISPIIDDVLDEFDVKFRVLVEQFLVGALNIYGMLTQKELKKILKECMELTDDGSGVFDHIYPHSIVLQMQEDFSDDGDEFYTSPFVNDVDEILEKRKEHPELKRPKHFDRDTIRAASEMPVPDIPNPHAKEMMKCLTKKLGMSEQDAYYHTFMAWRMVQDKDVSPVAIVQHILNESGGLSGGIDKLNEAMGTMMNYMNAAPRWGFYGHSPMDIQKKMGPMTAPPRIALGPNARKMGYTQEQAQSMVDSLWEKRMRSPMDLYDIDPFGDSNTVIPIMPMPKVGRNDPCPCGSGKKYKNCCGRGN